VSIEQVRPDRRNVAVLAAAQMLFGSARSLLIATAPGGSPTGWRRKKGLADACRLRWSSSAPRSPSIPPPPTSMRQLGRRGRLRHPAAFLGAGRRRPCAAQAVFQVEHCGCSPSERFPVRAVRPASRSSTASRPTDVAEPDYRSRAISLVLAGGRSCGVRRAGDCQDREGPDRLGAVRRGYLLLVGLCLLSAVVLMTLSIPKQTARGARRPAALAAGDRDATGVHRGGPCPGRSPRPR